MITFFWPERPAPGSQLVLHGDPARHARARRAESGNEARLVDGAGTVGEGRIVAVDRDHVTVAVERVVQLPRAVALDIIVPVADRDRMLWLAEKCVELQVTGWRPAYFARSRSVSPRGEGPKFAEKITARMRSALEQSGGAWLPEMHPEVEALDALSAAPDDQVRLLLDAGGEPLAGLVSNDSTCIAVGPEGGLERKEVDAAISSGWGRGSLGDTTLRFETAAIAAVAVIRATQLNPRS